MSVPDDLLKRSDPEFTELKKSTHRTERYLVGGWSDDGSVWVVGMRDRMANVEKAVRYVWVLASGVWAIALLLATAIAQSYFAHHPFIP